MLCLYTLREESVCERKFCSSTQPQNFHDFAEKTFAVGTFESILQNKPLRLTILKRFLQIKGVIW